MVLSRYAGILYMSEKWSTCWVYDIVNVSGITDFCWLLKHAYWEVENVDLELTAFLDFNVIHLCLPSWLDAAKRTKLTSCGSSAIITSFVGVGSNI